jgi:hypothetical protein
MKSMDDYLNEDITFDDNPRRKNSRDFDETLSQISSVSSNSSKGGGVGGGGSEVVDPPIKPKAVPRKSETKSSLLKKGVDTVMNTFRVFGTKTVNNSNSNNISSNNSVSSNDSYNSNHGNNGNLNLHIEEKSSNVLDTIAPLSEFNSTNLTRERTDTIKEQLNNDPKYMDKMFFQLTKTLDESEEEKENGEHEDVINPVEDFGVAIVANLDPIDETIVKKKENISDETQSGSEDIDAKQNVTEDVIEDDTNKNEIEEAIDPYLKKKRGKKKK